MNTTKVIIVDDDTTSRRMLRLLLEHDRNEVWEASSPEEAINALEAQAAPDLALVDLHLDSLSGVDLLRRLRADCVFGLLPVLFYSASPEREAVVEAMKLGTLGFLAKPVDPDRLRVLVNKARASDWMRIHFESADAVFRRTGIDREKRRDLGCGFFDGLSPIIKHYMASKGEHAAVLPQLMVLSRTAGELGLLSLRTALVQWADAVSDYAAPPFLTRVATLRRLFLAFSS